MGIEPRFVALDGDVIIKLFVTAQSRWVTSVIAMYFRLRYENEKNKIAKLMSGFDNSALLSLLAGDVNHSALSKDHNGENNNAFEEAPSLPVVMRPGYARKQAHKRFSLPANINLPPSFLRKHSINAESPMTRRLRRKSMVRFTQDCL